METIKKTRVCRRARRGGIAYCLFCTSSGEFALEGSLLGEKATVRQITRNFAKAEEIFNLIVRHKVHPCHLAEIVEDLLSFGE